MKALAALIAVMVIAVPAFAQANGWIGVSIQEQPDRGVLVRSVEANSPAEKAGLRANDVILQFNKEDVVGVLQLTRLVNETPVGRSVEITVRRDNREQTFKVTADKAPFAINPIRITTPNSNFEVLRDNLSRRVQPFEVITSLSTTQAGIRVDSLTPQLREFFGVKGNDGVLVSSVDANSAPAKAGLLAGDVITTVDARSVSNPQDFSRELRSRGATYTLKVVRNKQEREIKVER